MKNPPCVCKCGFFNALTVKTQGGVKMLRKDFILCKTRTLLNEFIGDAGDGLFDLVFPAGVGCSQLGMRVVFITVIDFCYDYVNTDIRQPAYRFG